tara:strand:- start:2876 stop:3154 length:279 start_codon:yes stop_codon:yes gene_type:complete
MNEQINNIIRLRNSIDDIDNQIFELFAKRFDISKKIGELKSTYKIPIDDGSRENAIIKRISKDYKNKIKPEHAEVLLKTIFLISKDIQKLKK